MMYLMMALSCFGGSVLVSILFNWFLIIRPEDRRLGVERSLWSALKTGGK